MTYSMIYQSAGKLLQQHIALARKKFRPQNTDDETILAEQTDYV